VLENGKLSDVFDQLNSLANVQQKIQEGIAEIEESKIFLENERGVLDDKRGELNQLKVLQMIQQRTVLIEIQGKSDLLVQTSGQESRFQSLLANAKLDADSAKNRLYLLEGTGLSMPLEQAFNYAQRASMLTGVRPAFLLAVLKRETSWGESVGTGNWRSDMNPRDRQSFIQICEKLNIDPDQTAVSKKPSYGWGGAIGPAQFLPSVWLSYESRIAKATGHKTPNPWDIGDAFVAAGLKLAENGADARTESAEWKAAQIYFAGNRWDHAVYSFYGDQVIDLAGTIQEQLELI
jgi:membrane-bound lytic murein transglycosylase B